MPWHSYRERDHAFGQAIFKLQREHCPEAARAASP